MTPRLPRPLKAVRKAAPAKAKAAKKAPPAKTPPPRSSSTGYRFVTRSEWGAAEPTGRTPRTLEQITTAHVHYADQPAGPADETDEAAIVRAIQQFHMGDQRGWADIGYHRLIGADGAVFEGRPLDLVGAETLGHNTGSAGYCFLTDGPVTDAAWSSFAVQLAADEGTIGRQVEVRPHSADVATSCPGDTIRARLASWLANGRQDGPGPNPPPQPAPGPQPAPDPLQEAIMQLPEARNDGGKTFSTANSKVQGLLIAQGTPPTPNALIDGFFGDSTENGVRTFQGRAGLTIDGIVGEATWSHLVGD